MSLYIVMSRHESIIRISFPPQFVLIFCLLLSNPKKWIKYVYWMPSEYEKWNGLRNISFYIHSTREIDKTLLARAIWPLFKNVPTAIFPNADIAWPMRNKTIFFFFNSFLSNGDSFYFSFGHKSNANGRTHFYGNFQHQSDRTERRPPNDTELKYEKTITLEIRRHRVQLRPRYWWCESNWKTRARNELLTRNHVHNGGEHKKKLSALLFCNRTRWRTSAFIAHSGGVLQ